MAVLPAEPPRSRTEVAVPQQWSAMCGDELIAELEVTPSIVSMPEPEKGNTREVLTELKIFFAAHFI